MIPSLYHNTNNNNTTDVYQWLLIFKFILLNLLVLPLSKNIALPWFLFVSD